MTTVLKLGGSVITEKDRERTVASDRLDRIAAALGDASVPDLVVVIGGGSFGHPAADRHGIDVEVGTTDPAAVTEVHGAMLALVETVVDRLVDAGVPAVAMHPLSMARRDADGLDVDWGATSLALEEGFVPVLHGDGVVTAGAGVTVVSGDELVVAAASRFDADRVGLCTGVPGVLDDEGRVIDRIDRYEAVAELVGDSEATDVTGGMAGKVRRLLELEAPASVFDIEGLAAFLDGDAPGTTIG